MREYLRYHCWDFILCALAGIGLSMTILSSFLTDDPMQRLPMLVLVSAVLSFVCLLAVYNRTVSVVALILGIAVVLLLFIMSVSRDVFDGDAGSETLAFYTVAVATALIVFLLCRCRPGIIVLLVAGNMVAAMAAFSGSPGRIWAYILFLAAVAALFFYRVYCACVLHSHSGKARFRGFLLQNVCVVLVALLVSAGIFFGIVQPHMPSADDPTLIERLRNPETEGVSGNSNTQTTVNEEIYAQNEPEDVETTREMTENQQEDVETGRILVAEPDVEEADVDLADASVETTPAQAFAHALKAYWWVLVIIVAAVIVFLILLRRILRRRWLAAIDRLPRADGVYNLYRFFLFGIGKSGYKKASNLTLEEFWASCEPQLRRFDSGGVDFGRLTDIYQKAYFGRQSVSEDEYADYLTYYGGFHKHVRKEAGFWRYLVLYFRL